MFTDIFELLEAVREYERKPKERLQPFGSVTGVDVGYTTADGEGPSVQWTILLRDAKASAQARGTREAERIRGLVGSYMGRKQLLDELLSGELSYGVARQAEHVEPVLELPKGPRQLLIPGL